MRGDTGEIYEDQVPNIDPQISEDFQTIMKWADETRRIRIETNAQQTRDFGAEDIDFVIETIVFWILILSLFLMKKIRKYRM
jgi:hypothetical protein